MQKIQFDYFTGMEAEQYSFYRVPKVLFTESCFKALSCEAKVLYGLMLDRMSLSMGDYSVLMENEKNIKTERNAKKSDRDIRRKIK